MRLQDVQPRSGFVIANSVSQMLAHGAFWVTAASFGISQGASAFDEQGRVEPKVIYGDDDRRDVYDTTNDAALVTLARSTAGLIRKSDLAIIPGNDNAMRTPERSLKQRQGVCDDEPFANQPSAMFCSGFLVGPDLFATAGHCITSAATCDSTAIVFDFAFATETTIPTVVPKSNIYSCKSIVTQQLNRDTQTDYAVIKLDRPVVGRQPVTLRRTGQLQVGDPLVVIGHPSGIPTKIAGGAAARNVGPAAYFVANLDTYGGNSGSAVFNTLTREVEGILVRGENDYVYEGSCMRSKRCANDACRGEDVTKTSEFVSFVP